MKLTNKQQLEKENLEWFCPEFFKQFSPQEREFEEYLAHSERGKPIKGFRHGLSKFNVYSEAKRWRGITIHELWEKDFYKTDGSWLGWYTLLKEENGDKIPEHIARYIAKEIFAGQDKKNIMDMYYERETASNLSL